MLLLVGGAVYFYSRTATDVVPLWVRHWDEIDVAAIQRDYQPYTVPQMRHLWHKKLVDTYDAQKEVLAQVDKLYPHDPYVARLLALGNPFVDFSDYENALMEQRLQLFSMRLYWEILSPAQRREYLQQRGFPPETTWHAYEEIHLKNDVVYRLNFRISMEQYFYINGTLPKD